MADFQRHKVAAFGQGCDLFGNPWVGIVHVQMDHQPDAAMLLQRAQERVGEEAAKWVSTSAVRTGGRRPVRPRNSFPNMPLPRRMTLLGVNRNAPRLHAWPGL